MTLLYTMFVTISQLCRRCRAEPPAFLLPLFCPPTAAHLLFGAAPKAGQMQAAEELGGKGLNSPPKLGLWTQPTFAPAHSPVPTLMPPEIASFQLNDLTFMLNMCLLYLQAFSGTWKVFLFGKGRLALFQLSIPCSSAPLLQEPTASAHGHGTRHKDLKCQCTSFVRTWRQIYD